MSVDGGASKTIAVIYDNNQIRGVGISGPSSFYVVGKRTAIANILSAIRQAKGKIHEIPRAVFCLSGAGDSNDSDEIVNEIVKAVSIKAFIKSYKVYNDGVAAYRVANAFEDGITVVTGSSNINYYQKNGILKRLGGWGWFAGDEGSASWIGRRALTYAIRQHDGLLEGYDLVEAVEEYFGKPLKKVIQQLELKPDKALVSGLATKVVELAKSGSSYANLILDEAVEYISTTIRKLLKEFDSTHPRISLVGGLMQAGDFLLNKVRHSLPSSLDFHVFYGYQAVIGGIVILDRIE
ncbi:hypothetical protein DJ523_05885, partial [Sulfolobus sp. E5]